MAPVEGSRLRRILKEVAVSVPIHLKSPPRAHPASGGARQVVRSKNHGGDRRGRCFLPVSLIEYARAQPGAPRVPAAARRPTSVPAEVRIVDAVPFEPVQTQGGGGKAAERRHLKFRSNKCLHTY